MCRTILIIKKHIYIGTQMSRKKHNTKRWQLLGAKLTEKSRRWDLSLFTLYNITL